jgi:hypothetical protein
MEELMTNSTVQSVESSPDRAVSQRRLEQLALARNKKTQTNTRLVARVKENNLLLWIYKFGFSSPEVIRHVVNDKNGRVVRRLLNRGLVETYLPPMGHVTGLFGCRFHLLILTTLGLGVARGLAVVELQYQEIHHSRINYRQAGHLLEIQLAVHRYMSGTYFSDFHTERQQAQKSLKGIKRFDAVLFRKNGDKFGLEVETSRKVGRELDEAQARIYSALQERKSDNSFNYREVFYLAHPSLYEKYSKKFSIGAKVYDYVKNGAGSYIRSNSIAEISQEVAERIRIEKIQGY